MFAPFEIHRAALKRGERRVSALNMERLSMSSHLKSSAAIPVIDRESYVIKPLAVRVSVAEQISGLSRTTIYQKIRDKKLRLHRVDGRSLVNFSDLEKLVFGDDGAGVVPVERDQLKGARGRRLLIEQELKKNPARSDSEIADVAGVHAKTVKAARARLHKQAADADAAAAAPDQQHAAAAE